MNISWTNLVSLLTTILDVVDQLKKRRTKSSEKIDETSASSSMETDEPTDPLPKERFVKPQFYYFLVHAVQYETCLFSRKNSLKLIELSSINKVSLVKVSFFSNTELKEMILTGPLGRTV